MVTESQIETQAGAELSAEMQAALDAFMSPPAIEVSDGPDLGEAPTNPRWADEAHREITAEWGGETIRFLAMPGILRYDQIVAAGTGIADPVPSVPATISDRQFFQQLAVDNIITENEALAAVQTGAIPSALLAIVEGMPANQQFSARMIITGATTFERTNSLTNAIGQAYGMSPAEIDDFFIAAALL